MPRPYVQILEKNDYDEAIYVCTDCGTLVGVSPLGVTLPPSQYDACPCTMKKPETKR